jgi:hypothetical protein
MVKVCLYELVRFESFRENSKSKGGINAEIVGVPLMLVQNFISH